MEVVKSKKKTKRKHKQHKEDNSTAKETVKVPVEVTSDDGEDERFITPPPAPPENSALEIPSVPPPTSISSQDETKTASIKDDEVLTASHEQTKKVAVENDESTVLSSVENDDKSSTVPPPVESTVDSLVEAPNDTHIHAVVHTECEAVLLSTENVKHVSPIVDLMQHSEDKPVENKVATVESELESSDIEQRQSETRQLNTFKIEQRQSERRELETSDVEQGQTQVEMEMVTKVEGEIPSAPLELEKEITYPRLDSLMEATIHNEVNDDLTPFSEQDLALMYVNPQLVANQEFVENFIKESEQSHHPLYELLTQYLKALLSLKEIDAKLSHLRKSYTENVAHIWKIEEKTITSTARCRDGNKVTHMHSHKYAELNQEALRKTANDLKNLRNCLENELCLKSYSAQLAHIHVEYYLHQLLQSVPGLSMLTPTSPVCGFIPTSPPGNLDHHTVEIRNSVSVLFMFERKPVRDETFSRECRQWLDLMINALLRVASLSDHLFLLNHVLRCPPGVGDWAVKYFQPLSPRSNKPLGRTTLDDISHDVEYSLDWTTSMKDCKWGGPVLDHWVTMLCTLLAPISARDDFLCALADTMTISRQESQRWTLVEEDLEEEIDEKDSLQLKESDYISFLDQFSFNEIFKYILQVSDEGSYSATGTTSQQMLQLLSFSTCLIRILGSVFSSLRQSRYKEFVKQVGRTVRQVVHYVADHWLNYKVYKERLGDSLSSLPLTEEGPYRYSLQRLQTEFDQFVLRATQWILTAHKLGAWQFMADMPYSSVSLATLWQILWTLYHYQFSSGDMASTLSGNILGRSHEQTMDRRGSVLSGRLDLDSIPETSEEVLATIRNPSRRAKFIDVLLKTYTSEAVFLLTTFVNMARSRNANTDEEMKFIETIVEDIFQFTQYEEFARDTYNRTGSNLLSTIASVHPFIISTVLKQAHSVISEIGENCSLLFKELPLHLWIPSRADMSIVYNWLTSKPLSSHENITAKIIISGLNWGVRDTEGGSPTLILPLALHREMALYVVEASSRQLPTHPGGNDYNASSSSIRKYASSIRSMMSTEQSEFSSWLWEVVLMLKLHPTQLSSISIIPPSPSLSRSSAAASSNPQTDKPPKNPMLYNPGWDTSVDTVLPDLSDTGVERLGILKEAVEKEGILAFYVALCLTNLGSLPERFTDEGLPMLNKLIEQGYYLPVLRVLGNVIPLMFGHRKMIINNPLFTPLLLAVANADVNSSSIKNILSWTTHSPLIVRKLSAMITTHIHHYGGSLADKQLVIIFWLESLFEISDWIREPSVLYLLNGLCIAVFGNMPLEQLLLQQLLDQYKLLQPLQQKNKGLLSSVASSVKSVVIQDGGGPSLYNGISASEYPWLSYYVLRAEQEFEEKEGIWKTILSVMKKDPKISVDNALKKALAELHHSGSWFVSSQLSIFKWGQFATCVDDSFLLIPLIWQKFFALYLQRPILDHNSAPERGSMGLRLFSSNQSQSLRREMKNTLSNMVKSLQQEIDSLNRRIGESEEENKEDMKLIEFLPICLKYYQTLKLWIQEPRLHEDTLHLPGLPKQYDSNKLAQVFKPHQEDWMELIKIWDIKDVVKVMVYEWGQVISYQNPLPCLTETLDFNPETAAARIEKRLSRRAAQVEPSAFQFPPAPFSLFGSEILLSKSTLLPLVIKDIEFIAQQTRVFVEKQNTLSALDAEYISAVPELYVNIDRQFHVNMPCRSKTECRGAATVVFRFKEMTAHSMWEQRLPDNRKVHTEMIQALSNGLSVEFCKAVARTEHVVGELVKLAMVNNTEALSSGVALFYEILKFIGMEVEQFPPSSQFFTTSIEVLGQEFIENDPSQTATILQMIVSHRPHAKLLSPVFVPNSCPGQFLSMYSKVTEVALKVGPDLAFSVLSKFSVLGWLKESTPSINDCRILLDSVFVGIKQSSSINSQEHRSLLEVYISHLKCTVDYEFPMLYNDALYNLVSGTEVSSIVSECWDEILNVVSPSSQHRGSSCRLGSQSVVDSLKYLAEHFTQKRLVTQECLYDLIQHSSIVSIGQFINMLSDAMISKTVDSIELGNTSPNQGHLDCWHAILETFTPWIFPVHVVDTQDTTMMQPCKLEDTLLMSEILKLFASSISTLHNAFKVYGECSLSLLWSFYCKHLADVPDHVLQCYHIHFATMPWQCYQPDLESMNLMLQLKLESSHPTACFVFVGEIIPAINWKSLDEQYRSCSSEDTVSSFYILFLKLLVMLANETQVMSKKNTRLPYLLSEAKSYGFHHIDSRTFNDVLQWLKQNCYPVAVLEPGSPLSSSIRFLQSVASFPVSDSSDNLLQAHKNGWEKRYAFTRFVVDLVSRASHQKDTLNSSYSEIIVFLIQSAVDVSIFEPESCLSAEVVTLLQEILHLFNICNPVKSFQHLLVDHLSSCLLELPNAQHICIPTITAACRTLVSVPLMICVTENSILAYFKYRSPPEHQSVQLPFSEDGYGWKDIQMALQVPELAYDDFTENCIVECACLSLHTRLLQTFPQCTSLDQEFKIAYTIVQWCTKLKPKPEQEAGVFLMWEKACNLLLRQLKYGNDVAKVVPHFTTLATTLLRCGEDKATEGLLGAIGLGKKSTFSIRFRLIARILATFIHCQMPMDSNHSTIIRTAPNALGHIKTPTKQHASTPIIPSKQADQAMASLEALLSNKNYTSYYEHISYSLEFINDSRFCLFDISQLLIYLLFNIYCNERFLDVLRIISL